MSAPNYTDTYGPGTTGEFIKCDAEDLVGGDILPSHDGYYHEVEGVSTPDDKNVVEVNVSVTAISGGSIHRRYSVEWPALHRVSVLA